MTRSRAGYDSPWKCEVRLRFTIVKLLDYDAQWSALEQSRNPFAGVVMAPLKAQATRRRSRSRLRWKVELVKGFILALRFQTIPQPPVDAITRLTNPVLLNLLLKQAVLSPSLAEFQQALTAEAQNGHSANPSDERA